MNEDNILSILNYFIWMIEFEDDIIPEDSKHNTPHESPISEVKVTTRAKTLRTWSNEKKKEKMLDAPVDDQNVLIVPMLLSFIDSYFLSQID